MPALGALGSSGLKGLALGLIFCGAMAVPVVTLTGGGDQKKGKDTQPNLEDLAKKTTPHQEKVTQSLPKSGFSLKKIGGNTSLNFEFKNSFDPDKGLTAQTRSFYDVKMAFGDYVLQAGDYLFSPKQDGVYYLAKGRGGAGWELPDGKLYMVFHRFNGEGQDYKHIKLNWPRSGWSPPLSKISLGSCTFTRINPRSSDWKIRMTCYESIGAAKLNIPGEPTATTILSKSDFQEFFNQK